MNFLILGKPVHLDFSDLSEPRELKDERVNLENAHLLATDQKRPQTVIVGGRKMTVEEKGYGREIRPS